MTDQLPCTEVRDLIPELAAAVASGDERAEALAHLARCPACRGELEETAAVVDDLLLLGPSKEPPPGFETSVLGRIRSPRRPERRGRHVLRVAAVLVVAAVLGSGATMWATARERQLASGYERTLAVANGEYFTARELTIGSQQEVGHLFAYEGAPSWIFMTVTDKAPRGSYEMELVSRNGDSRTLGECLLAVDGGGCGAEIDVRLRDVLLIRLTKPGEPSLIARF
ncbi:MAG: anti-sigma factor family protein [Actinomycetota bacterium]